MIGEKMTFSKYSWLWRLSVYPQTTYLVVPWLPYFRGSALIGFAENVFYMASVLQTQHLSSTVIWRSRQFGDRLVLYALCPCRLADNAVAL